MGDIFCVGSQLAQKLPHILEVGVARDGIGLLSGPLVGKYLINGQLEGIVEHPRDELPQQGTGTFDAGVFIDLNEPYFEFLVDDVIQPKQLEAELTVVLVDLLVDRAIGHVCNFFHPLPDFVRLLFSDDFAQPPKRQLVAIFEHAVAGRVLLDGIVGQMDEIVVDVIELELLGRCADVPLLKEVKVVVLRQQCPHSDIELPFLNQEWPLDILLNHERARA